MSKNIVILLSIIIISTSLSGEEPTRLSRKWLAEAEEKIDIIVVDVEVKDVSDPPYMQKLVNVRAEVTKIRESKSGLRSGVDIFILYVHRYDKIPGPSKIPVLLKGKNYKAFLNRVKNKITSSAILMKGWDEKKQFAPAALGKSFVRIE